MTWRSNIAALAAFIGATGGVLLVCNEHPHPTRPTGHVRTVPVTTAALTCPGTTSSPLLGTQTSVSVFAVAPGRPDADVQPGQLPGLLAVTSGETGAGLPLTSTRDAGLPLRARVRSEGSVTVRARGELAPGATAVQIATYRGKTGGGLAASWCLGPRPEWWFNGVDTTAAATTRLVLVNPSPAVAVVAVHIFGSHRGQPPGADAIAVPARSRGVLDLARFAPGRTSLSVSVTASRGAVVAAVLTRRVEGTDRGAIEWLPVAAAPAATVVVNAGVSGQRQSIAVTNTGLRQAVVRVRILGSDGAFTSTRLPPLQVPAGSVVVRRLDPSTLRQASAVLLRASVPVTGSILSTASGKLSDLSVASTSDALAAPAVVATIAGTAMRIAFTSADPGLAAVRVRRYDGTGALIGVSTVLVRGLTTTSWSPPGPATSYCVVDAPPRSAVHAVATYTGPTGTTQLPVESGSYSIRRPAVAPL